MVFVAPFHHHDTPLSQENTCEECTHHQPHPGHLTQKTGAHECLICQLLAQVYVPVAGLQVKLPSSDCTAFYRDCSGDVLFRFTPQSSPRSPPVSFCF